MVPNSVIRQLPQRQQVIIDPRIHLELFLCLKVYTLDDVLLYNTAKKRSYLILKPTRHLILFRDGCFAYFKIEKQEVELKTYLRPKLIVNTKDIVEDNRLVIETQSKNYYFYFNSNQLAELWAISIRRLSC
jgi:hypothetical protein